MSWFGEWNVKSGEFLISLRRIRSYTPNDDVEQRKSLEDVEKGIRIASEILAEIYKKAASEGGG